MSHDKNVHDKKMHDKKSYDKKENENIIEGRNAVMEAFRSGKPKKLLCTGRMIRNT